MSDSGKGWENILSSACYCLTGVNALGGDIKVFQTIERLVVIFLEALFTTWCKTRES